MFGKGDAKRTILKEMTMMDNMAGFGYAGGIKNEAD